MGRGRSGANGGTNGRGWVSSLQDAKSFNEFVQLNKDNEKLINVASSEGMGAVREIWMERRMQTQLQNLHEMSLDDAENLIVDTIPDSILQGWFGHANSAYKPKIMEYMMSDDDMLSASMAVAYDSYRKVNWADSNPMTFQQWLRTPQTYYRGTHGQSNVAEDLWSAFTPDRKIAEYYAGRGGRITSIKIRPIDTYGALSNMIEAEIMIPEAELRKRRK